MQKKQGIPHRFFWTWDHSTNWCMNILGSQTCGVGNPYLKNPEMFEYDYMRAIDWCAEHRIDGIGIAGMLRDRHGGVESARKVCAYAREKGVLVYIIAGLFAYGGIYYEGDHKYSLNKFFEKNPECIGVNADGSPVIKHCPGRGGSNVEAQGCASNPLLKEFILESLDWLFKEIPELGGIQMESSDTGICQCAKCKSRRSGKSDEQYISVEDMAAIYPDASDTILKRDKDALVICVPYHHYLEDVCKIFDDENPSADLKKLFDMPESTFWQWRFDTAYRDGYWKNADPVMKPMQKFHHIMRSHAGTQWWGGRNTLSVEKIRNQCMLSHRAGLDAVSIFGETSPFHTNAEFNYLAMEYFADNPENSTKNFIDDMMAPRLGGIDNADAYYEMAQLHIEIEKIPNAVDSIAKIAAAQTDFDVRRRWQYLGNFLNSYYWEIKQGGDLKLILPNGTDRPDL